MQTSLDLAMRNSLRPRLSAAMTLAAGMPSPAYYCDVGAAGGIDNVIIESLRQQGAIRVIGCEPDGPSVNG